MNVSRVLAVAAGTSVLSLAPTAARAVVPDVSQEVTQYARCQTVDVPSLSGYSYYDIDTVTVCTPKVVAGAWIVGTSSSQGVTMCGLVPCIRVYVPAAATRVDPISIEVQFVNGTRVQQIVPAGTMRIETPSPSCVVNTDPADPDRCWV